MFHTTLVPADEFGYYAYLATMNRYFPEWTLLFYINVKASQLSRISLKKELIFMN